MCLASSTTAPSPDTPPPARLLDLPTDLLLHVVSRCDPVDIARAAAVSLLFHASLAVEGIRLRAQERSYELPAQPEDESFAVRDEGVTRLNTPNRLPSTLGERVGSVAAGDGHSLALTANTPSLSLPQSWDRPEAGAKRSRELSSELLHQACKAMRPAAAEHPWRLTREQGDDDATKEKDAPHPNPSPPRLVTCAERGGDDITSHSDGDDSDDGAKPKEPRRSDSDYHHRHSGEGAALCARATYVPRLRTLQIDYYTRSEEMKESKYVHMEAMDAQWPSREDAILATSLAASDVTLEPNMFPYTCPPGIEHWTLWCVRDMTDDQVEVFVENWIATNKPQVIAWNLDENATRSVDLFHLHIYFQVA